MTLTKSLLTVFLVYFGLNLFAQSVISERSSVNFEITALQIGKVKGNFAGINGTVLFDKSNLNNSKIDVCVDVSSVTTGNKKRDKNLRDKKFFYVEEYPQICFQSDSIIKTQTDFKAVGSLTMHGITKKIEIDFNVSENKLIGETEISRFDFEIGTIAHPKTFLIGEDVVLEIVCFVD